MAKCQVCIVQCLLKREHGGAGDSKLSELARHSEIANSKRSLLQPRPFPAGLARLHALIRA